MLVSIMVYGLTALVLYVLAQDMAQKDRRALRVRGKHALMWTSSFVISILVFAMVAGMRYNTGVDHLSYLDHYMHGGDDTDELGFYWITRVLYSLDIHYFFYFAFWAALQIIFIYYGCKYKRELLPYVALSIMLGPYFLNWMNGIRQTLVECFFVAVTAYYCNNKSLKSLIWSIVLVLLASFIHRSAVVLVALLLLAMINIPLKNRLINIGVVVACLVIGATPYWINMNSTGITEILSLMGYDHYSMIYEDMVEMADFKETAFGPLRLMTLFVDLAIIWFYPKMREMYADDKVLGVFFMFFFFGVCAYNLFANTNILFLRPVEYLTIFRLPMTAYLLCYLKRANKSWFAIMCLFVFTYALVEVLKSGILGVKETNLYHFFFFQ